MKNQITFMSGLFESQPDSSTEAGGNHFGGDLAEWIVTRSNGSEFVFAKPVRTETGWSDHVTVDGESFVLGFDLGAKSVDADYAEWVITIDKPRKFKFFGPKDSPSRARLCDLIHNILRDERGIREVQWGS
ncbi:MAG: hypothetical protein WKF34_01500 [Pyrinomonadaceae bacterium]